MSFGRFLRLDIRGASHARKMSFSLDGFPAGFRVDASALAAFMARRAPGRDVLSTARREADEVKWVSGIGPDGVTGGGTIRGEIANCDARPGDYGAERTVPRPGHADFGQWIETGRIPTGGGKNSGRLTAPLCAAGALALQWLARRGIAVHAHIAAIGDVSGGTEKDHEKAVLKARERGDSVGGVVGCSVEGLPPGLGGPLFEGLEAGISAAMFGIPGVKGVVFGEKPGYRPVCATSGSRYNDRFCVKDGRVVTATLRQGGILGGRTYGMPVVFSVAMRPTPTVFVGQNSVDLRTMKQVRLEMKGRHDPCIVLRAVPVVEAATALAVMEAVLADEAARPRICLTLTGKTLEEDIGQFRSQRYFADMVELRVDLLRKEERAKAAKFPEMLAKEASWKVPAVLTFRRVCDGGAYKGAEGERAKFFEKVLAATTFAKAAAVKENAKSGFDYVDFEEGFGGEKLLKLAHAASAKVVRSLHKFNGPVKNLAETLKKLGRSGDIAKVAFMPRGLDDVTKVFDEMAGVSGGGFIVCAMGAQGLATRVLASRLGSAWTYASVGGLDGIGHVTPSELVRDYRFRTVSPSAALFGVTGWPLERTRSPELHNAAFAAEDEDAVMVPFPAKTAREALAFMKATGMKGMAVTIPHKLEIMPLLDKIDGFAKKVGAVNTVAREHGKYVGYNTDVAGFAEALSAFAGDLRGRTVAVLGDGGAAQAVKAALATLGAQFRVFYRETPPPGFDVIVNATPVDPIPGYRFSGNELVYDLRYVPATTPLMERAAAAGCRVENGFTMLAAQARAQRRIWGA